MNRGMLKVLTTLPDGFLGIHTEVFETILVGANKQEEDSFLLKGGFWLIEL